MSRPPSRPPAAPIRRSRFRRLHADGAPDDMIERDVPEEIPVAVEVNGIALAVMMATPDALEDFAVGFARAEGLLHAIDELEEVSVHVADAGRIARLWLTGAARDRILARARARVTESACGLCGLTSLEAVAAPLPRLDRPLLVAPGALRRAFDALPQGQRLGRMTGATHAAALCDARGAIRLVREDIGRHNALDKLVGAALRDGIDTSAHFAFVTSRLSYELVEKAARAPLGAIAAISAPTAMALDRARAAGLPIFALARGDSALTLPDPA